LAVSIPKIQATLEETLSTTVVLVVVVTTVVPQTGGLSQARFMIML
jgi:hypothetical protein